MHVLPVCDNTAWKFPYFASAFCTSRYRKCRFYSNASLQNYHFQDDMQLNIFTTKYQICSAHTHTHIHSSHFRMCKLTSLHFPFRSSRAFCHGSVFHFKNKYYRKCKCAPCRSPIWRETQKNETEIKFRSGKRHGHLEKQSATLYISTHTHHITFDGINKDTFWLQPLPFSLDILVLQLRFGR